MNVNLLFFTFILIHFEFHSFIHYLKYLLGLNYFIRVDFALNSRIPM